MPRWLNSLVPLQNAAFTSLNDFNIPELKRPSIRRQLAISIIVLLICVAVLSSLDDKFIDKHIKEG